ncbi:MAG: hypothetical protein V3T08_08710 [Gemmatimonadota bacterium]
MTRSLSPSSINKSLTIVQVFRAFWFQTLRGSEMTSRDITREKTIVTAAVAAPAAMLALGPKRRGAERE